MENLKKILENQQDGYVIWGKNYTGECVAEILLKCGKKMIYFWDEYKTGEMVSGIRITSPGTVCENGKNLEEYCIILAVESDENYQKCTQILKGIGFTNIVNGRILKEEFCWAKVCEDKEKYEKENKRENFRIKQENDFIFTDEWLKSAGVPVRDEYFQQDLWGAQRVFENRPEVHYDIGSRIDGFIAHLLSFKMQVVLIDIRPFDKGNLENLTFIQEDATLLSGVEDGSIHSLSALCSLEHFGLGRYGDPIDPDADLKAFASINRVTAHGANVYISLPVGRERLHFNAHRVYDPRTVINAFKKGDMDLIEFSCTSEKGVIRNIEPDFMSEKFAGSEVGLYGEATGLFHFRKVV